MPFKLLKTSTLALCCAFGTLPALSSAAADTASHQISPASPFDTFTPRPSRTTSLNYDAYDMLLSKTVLYTGPATRRRADRPQPTAGSHFIVGHTSPYRMEGNKLAFAALDGGHLAAFTELRQVLQTIAAENDIASFSHNEQLAFWINLHNVSVIEQIALAYPKRTPSKIKVGPKTADGKRAVLHEAKFIRIGGLALSPRDIREKIVYPNWPDPVVAYGFFLGDIGSPSLKDRAYTGENVNAQLAENAREFTNALRGFHKRGDTGMVSRIYQDMAPFYFKDYEADLRAHLTAYMDDDVAAELAEMRSLKAARYEDAIADLSGGTRMPASIAGTTVEGRRLGGTGANAYVRELAEKRRLLIKQGKIVPGQGIVTIKDKPTN